MNTLLRVFKWWTDTKDQTRDSSQDDNAAPWEHDQDAKSNFPDFSHQDSYVRTYLTPEMYEVLYPKVTPLGVRIDRCIQIACEKIKKERVIGLVAGDEYSYELFRSLFDPVIEERYVGLNLAKYTPRSDLDISKLTFTGVLDEKYVKSVRVRTGRNLRGFRMSSCISRAERRQTESIVTSALNYLQDDLKGSYHPLSTISEEKEEQLRMAQPDDDFYLERVLPLKRVPPLKKGATILDFYELVRSNQPVQPEGCQIYIIWHSHQVGNNMYNTNKTFLSWMNEEDHCRIISMQEGGDIRAVFERFVRGYKEFERRVKDSGYEFQWNDRLGYLTMCTSNVGTGFRCSVHIQLKHLGKHPSFHQICGQLGMSKRPTHGNYSEVIDDVYAIANKDRMKKTEVEYVTEVVEATNKLIEMEKQLEQGGEITV